MSIDNERELFYTRKKYSHQKSPLHSEVLRTNMKMKDQDMYKEYLEKKCSCSIRVVREEGMSVFMSSEDQNIKVRKFIFDHIMEMAEEFHMDGFKFSCTFNQIM